MRNFSFQENVLEEAKEDSHPPFGGFIDFNLIKPNFSWEVFPFLGGQLHSGIILMKPSLIWASSSGTEGTMEVFTVTFGNVQHKVNSSLIPLRVIFRVQKPSEEQLHLKPGMAELRGVLPNLLPCSLHSQTHWPGI